LGRRRRCVCVCVCVWWRRWAGADWVGLCVCGVG
jgi:hypothetical protein